MWLTTAAVATCAAAASCCNNNETAMRAMHTAAGYGNCADYMQAAIDFHSDYNKYNNNHTSAATRPLLCNSVNIMPPPSSPSSMLPQCCQQMPMPRHSTTILPATMPAEAAAVGYPASHYLHFNFEKNKHNPLLLHSQQLSLLPPPPPPPAATTTTTAVNKAALFTPGGVNTTLPIEIFADMFLQLNKGRRQQLYKAHSDSTSTSTSATLLNRTGGVIGPQPPPPPSLLRKVKSASKTPSAFTPCVPRRAIEVNGEEEFNKNTASQFLRPSSPPHLATVLKEAASRTPGAFKQYAKNLEFFPWRTLTELQEQPLDLKRRPRKRKNSEEECCDLRKQREEGGMLGEQRTGKDNSYSDDSALLPPPKKKWIRHFMTGIFICLFLFCGSIGPKQSQDTHTPTYSQFSKDCLPPCSDNDFI